MILDFWNISINDNFVDFFNIYAINLNYDLFQSRFNLYTNYNHYYYYLPVNDTILITKIYTEIIYYNLFHVDLLINFDKNISFILMNDLSYSVFYILSSAFSAIWRTITFSRDYIIPPIQHKFISFNISDIDFHLFMQDNFSRLLLLNSFFQINEFMHLNLINYEVPLGKINKFSIQFLQFFVWKELFYEKGVEDYAFSYGELHFLDKVNPLVLGAFPSYTLCINYSDLYCLPIWLSNFNDWNNLLKYTSYVNLVSNSNDILMNYVNNILLYRFFEHHYPADLKWSEYNIIQYMYSNYMYSNSLMIWCCLFVLILAICELIILVCLSIILVYSWIINVKFVILFRKNYLNLFFEYYFIFLSYLKIKLLELNEYLIRNYVYDVVFFKPFWFTRMKLFWISIEYKYFLSVLKGSNYNISDQKMYEWYYEYLTRNYPLLMGQYIAGYFFRYFYFFINLFLLSIWNTLKYLGLKVTFLYGILIFLYYVWFISMNIIKVFVNMNIIKILWKLYINIINKFLIWFLFSFNFSRIRMLSYWYYKVPYYYKQETYMFFPLNHSLFIVKFFSLFYLININKSKIKLNYYNFFKNFILIDFIIFIIFKIFNIISYILYYLLSLNSKIIYKIYLKFIMFNFNFLNYFFKHNLKFICLLLIIFFLFYKNIIILLYFLLFVIFYILFYKYINNIFFILSNSIYYITGFSCYFMLFYFSSIFRLFFISIFFIIFKLKYIIILIILFNIGFDFIYFMILLSIFILILFLNN